MSKKKNALKIARKFREKIISLKEMNLYVKQMKKKNFRIVMCHGCFDIIHFGHILHFQTSKKFGDKLIVTITKDKYVNKGPDRPIFNHYERAIVLSGIGVIDKISINNKPSAANLLLQFKPHVYSKGYEYASKKQKINPLLNDERNIVKNYGGKMKFTMDNISSSTRIIQKLYERK